jgi:hypothetical protein
MMVQGQILEYLRAFFIGKNGVEQVKWLARYFRCFGYLIKIAIEVGVA